MLSGAFASDERMVAGHVEKEIQLSAFVLKREGVELAEEGVGGVAEGPHMPDNAHRKLQVSLEAHAAGFRSRSTLASLRGTSRFRLSSAICNI